MSNRRNPYFSGDNPEWEVRLKIEHVAMAAMVALAAGVAAIAADRDEVPAAVRQTITTANNDWLKAMKAQDAAGVAAPYADDAVFVLPTGEAVQGRAAIERMSRERFARTGRVVDGTIGDDGLTRTGQYVYEWGHANLRVAAGEGRTVESGGHFLTVWAADANGRWRIIRNLSLP
jgi:uncharacterized protein (TIGR02246 family)